MQKPRVALAMLTIGLAIAFTAACGSSAPAPSPSPSASAQPAKAGASAQPASPSASAQPAKAEDAEWAKIVEAAKKEGKVVIYGPFTTEAQAPEIAAFKKKYPGIEVEVVYNTGSRSAERVRAEYTAGKMVADIWRGGTNPALFMREEGMLEKWVAPSLVRERDQYAFLPGKDEDEKGYLSNVYATAYGLVINTNRIKPADEPKSWFDLTQPKYKGLISMNDPRNPSPGQSLMWAIRTTLGQKGEEYLSALAKQGLVFEANYGKQAEDVARGEYGIAVPMEWQFGQSSPSVKFILPTEGVYYVVGNAVIIKGAPHPNAAKVWIEWEASKEGQQVMADSGLNMAIRKDVTAKYPWLRLDTAKPWAGISFQERLTAGDKEMRAVAERIFFGK